MNQPPTESVHARVGTILREKWVLGPVIGGGGTATVYEATHKTNGRRVAVKIMHAHLSESHEVVSRFMREGYIANKVGHPGAVTILDDDTTEDGSPFLVMDRLDGAPLTRLLERARDGLEVGPALRIAHEVLDVLAAAHAQGITHRDIKPDNVFLTSSGKVMLLDFGIARIHEHIRTAARADVDKTVRMQQTQEGLALGTPMYMPPEQARGRWSEVDGRSDLWALGAIMFRLLSGRPVRLAETPADMLLQAMTERPRHLGEVAPHLPPDVVAIVDRALELKKEDRWPDALAMQAAIRDAATRVAASKGSGARAMPSTPPPPQATMPSTPPPPQATMPSAPVAPPPPVAPVLATPARAFPQPPPAPPRPPPPRIEEEPVLSRARGKTGMVLALVALVIVGLLGFVYVPRATHGPAAKASPSFEALPAAATPATTAPAAAPTASEEAPTVNVEDLPSATVTTEPTAPPRAIGRPRRRASAPDPTPDPAAAAPSSSVLDRRH